MTDKEKTLIGGCLNGDKAAWDAFVLQYSSLVYHTIKKTLVLNHAEISSDLVDDLFQDVFLSLVKDDCAQLRRFRGDRGCTLASWLRMIAGRRTIDHLRKLKTPANPLEESLPNGADDESEDERSDNQFQLLDKAIATLRPGERILIDLFFRQNLSVQDVASILHLTVGAVYTQKNRLLAKLREILEKARSL